MHPLRAVGVLALILAPAAAVEALVFPAGLVFREDYLGETVFPTSPEVDALAFGGVFGSSNPGLTETPTLTGTSAHVSVAAPGERFQLTVTSGGTIGTGSIGMRGVFANLDILGSTGFGSAGLQLDYTGGDPDQIFASVTVQKGSPSMAVFRLAQFDSFEQAALVEELVPLSDELTVALLAGNAFTIDLYVDRSGSSETIVASLDVPGEGAVTTSTLALIPDLGSPGTLQFAIQAGGSPSLVPDSVELDMTELELYAGPLPALPALGTLGRLLTAVVIALGALAPGWRRGRRVKLWAEEKARCPSG